jgi:hypothetical protein
VKLYVGYLRRKLDPAAPKSTPIETVRGFGYRYRRSSERSTKDGDGLSPFSSMVLFSGIHQSIRILPKNVLVYS